jgi:hypothetical protein
MEPMFWQQVWSTAFGTVAGFVFSIVLFYMTEHIKRGRDRAKILKGLRRELQFNLALFASWLKGIEDARPQVVAGDKSIFLYLDYTRVLSIFIGQAVREGILYDLLTDDDLVGLDKVLKSSNPQNEQEFYNRLNQWKAGQIDNAEMFKTFEFHKFVVSTSKKALETVSAKIATAK